MAAEVQGDETMSRQPPPPAPAAKPAPGGTAGLPPRPPPAPLRVISESGRKPKPDLELLSVRRPDLFRSRWIDNLIFVAVVLALLTGLGAIVWELT